MMDKRPDQVETIKLPGEVASGREGDCSCYFRPGMGGQVYLEHMHRYCFASRFCRDKCVLDIASGDGYGAFILAQSARRVIGIDLQASLLTGSARKYSSQPNLRFVAGDCAHIPIRAASIDLAVSFETLEHLADLPGFLGELKRVLKRDGILLISTPNRRVYNLFLKSANPFHLNELTSDEFQALAGRYFTHTLALNQQVLAGSLLASIGAPPDKSEFLFFEEDNNRRLEISRSVRDLEYNVLLASDAQVPDSFNSFYLGSRRQETGEHLSIRRDFADRYLHQVPVQLFFDRGGGFSETDSITRYADPVSPQIPFTLEQPLKLRAFRLDPCDDACIIRIQEARFSLATGQQAALVPAASNAVFVAEDIFVFNQRDPWIIFQVPENVSAIAGITFSIEYRAIGQAALPALFSELFRKHDRQARRSARLRRTLDRARTKYFQKWAELDQTRFTLEKESVLSVVRLTSDPYWRLLFSLRQLTGRVRPISLFLDRLILRIANFRHARDLGLLQSSPLFDPEFYLSSHPDVAASGIDPAVHFLHTGWKEGRDPSPAFNVLRYLKIRPDVARAGLNPLIHHLRFGSAGSAELQDAPDSGQKKTLPPRRLDAVSKSAGYEPARPFEKYSDAIKAIAFYLPQYHPIPENDAWWGQGFTEWTKVSQARPLFPGHYQPRIPDALGYYDLRVVEVQQRQAELASRFGLHGFCYYYYWFNGKTLLELPLRQMLAHPEIDFPFCLCWANENWTRQWDGLSQDILIRQEYSSEQDLLFIQSIEPYLRDPRYIRVEGRPLLLAYRPDLFPDVKRTTRLWRDYCLKSGIGDLFLAMVQTTFGGSNPDRLGFDAAVQFPPHHVAVADVTHSVRDLDPEFSGLIYSYPHLVEKDLQRKRPSYTLFRGIMPSWDNTARRATRSHLAYGATPQLYQEWLSGICDYTRENLPRDRRLVFINAWNEWAEGTYLEPDSKYGYAYLNRTAEVLADHERVGRPGEWKILFVSHDACLGGSQSVLLNILRWFKDHTRVTVKILLLSGGAWADRFNAITGAVTLAQLQENDASEETAFQRLKAYCGGAPDLIYANSVASGRAFGLLRRFGKPILTHFHELPRSIAQYARDCIDDVIGLSDHFVACSGAVRDSLIELRGVPPEKITTVPASITPLLDAEKSADFKQAAKAARRKLAPKGERLIFGCGIGMAFRKGADLFLDVAARVVARGGRDVRFIWIGGFQVEERDAELGRWGDHLARLKKDRLEDRVVFLGQVDNPRELLAGGDLFLLPSREDPFPLVCLEAAECRLPIVCFAGAGGMPDFVESDAGRVVPYLDTEAMAAQVETLLADEPLRVRLGETARGKVLDRYTFARTTPAILDASARAAGRSPAVSVIVPNYNHARYLEARLESIYRQTCQDFEVILLDDASTDGSQEILQRFAGRPRTRLILNSVNSGSPFRQWLKGLDAASGEIVWMAESDDLAEPTFLEHTLAAFQDPFVRLAYADSWIIDEDGRRQGDYQECDYLLALSRTKWRSAYTTSLEQELADGFGIKNTILNASAVLFRRFAPDEALRAALQDLRLAGDWYFFIHAALGGRIHYTAAKENFHRRHSRSVFGAIGHLDKKERLFREIAKVHEFIYGRFRFGPDFRQPWESYLRRQWADFFPGRPFAEIEHVYPFTRLKQQLGGSDARRPAELPGATGPKARNVIGTYSDRSEKVILKDLHAIYVTIPKTGCTSIKQFLSDHFRWKVVDNVHNRLSEIYQHIENGSIETPEFDGWFKFTFVRNPYSRLYSTYKSKVSRSGFHVHPLWIDGVEECIHQLGVRYHHDFAQFVDIVFSYPDDQSDPHLKSQFQFIYNPAGERVVPYVFYFEDFVHSMEQVRILAGMDDALAVPHENRFQNSPSEYVTHYTPELIERVAERYALDFELFGYPKDFNLAHLCPLHQDRTESR